MKPLRLLLSAILAAPLLAQQPVPAATPGPLTARFTDLLTRASNGHSPSTDDITDLTNHPLSVTAPDLQTALPLIQRALANPDTPIRTYTLTALVTLEDAPAAVTDPAPPTDSATPEPEKTVTPPPPGPPAYKPDFAKLLTPILPKITPHLTEESQPNRLLTAAILGGFTPAPPPAVYPPLLAFLKRDDAIGPIGLAVVQDLLQLAPLTPEVSDALARYLSRSDQTTLTRPNLVDAIASSPNQSPSLNKTMLAFLDSDDTNLRARVILSLPTLDLAPDLFADTKARVTALAANDQENLQVVSAAKAVAPCWTAVKMPTGCPIYQ